MKTPNIVEPHSAGVRHGGGTAKCHQVGATGKDLSPGPQLTSPPAQLYSIDEVNLSVFYRLWSKFSSQAPKASLNPAWVLTLRGPLRLKLMGQDAFPTIE